MNADSLVIKNDKEVLQLLGQAFETLTFAESLEDYVNVRDTAEAVRVLAKNARVGIAVRNRVAELRLRAERGAGEILRSMTLRGGDRKSKVHQARLTLSELGITGNESTRWQKIAAVPESEFREFVSAGKAGETELTSASLLRLAATLSRPDDGQVASASERGDDYPSTGTGHVDSSRQVIAELVNHWQVLNRVLTPLCDGPHPSGLRKGQRRHLRRLSGEFAALLDQLQQITET